MWNTFVHKTVADAVVGRFARGNAPPEFRFLLLPLGRIGKEVEGITGTHQASASQGQRDPTRVDGDPAAAPLFGDIGGGARTTGRIQNQITRIGGHEYATPDDTCRSLYNIYF